MRAQLAIKPRAHALRPFHRHHLGSQHVCHLAGANTERESTDAGSAWLAVVLGAAGTWLSFGLLALSSTPALRSFGLTLLFGILLVWFAAPLYRQPSGRGVPRPAPRGSGGLAPERPSAAAAFPSLDDSDSDH